MRSRDTIICPGTQKSVHIFLFEEHYWHQYKVFWRPILLKIFSDRMKFSLYFPHFSRLEPLFSRMNFSPCHHSPSVFLCKLPMFTVLLILLKWFWAMSYKQKTRTTMLCYSRRWHLYLTYSRILLMESTWGTQCWHCQIPTQTEGSKISTLLSLEHLLALSLPLCFDNFHRGLNQFCHNQKFPSGRNRFLKLRNRLKDLCKSVIVWNL